MVDDHELAAGFQRAGDLGKALVRIAEGSGRAFGRVPDLVRPLEPGGDAD